MSQFTAPITVTPLPDGKSWVIVTPDFRYDVDAEGSGDTVRVPRGMVTDFASVPRPVWWFAAPWGKHGHAAVIHDAGYYTQDRTRREYDRIFLQAMGVLGVRWPKKVAMFAAVRGFGFLSWWMNARRNQKDPGWKIINPGEIPVPGDLEIPVPAVSPIPARAVAPSAEELRRAFEAARRV